MRYEARVTAYDVMDQVWVGVTVHSQEDVLSTGSSVVLHMSEQVTGVGESDPREWLRDVLVALLETT